MTTQHAPLIVVMGPSATGKSTIGAALAAALGVPFVDGDDLHPAENTAKMASGVPLTDDDRWPWLDACGAALAEAEASGGLVLACSALRRAYRDRIRAGAPTASFLHLHLTEEEALRRASSREGHFMPASLVASQYATLEPLDDDEAGTAVDATLPPDAVVAAALAALRRAL
ncbi:gluconokinase [Demequina sp. SYSU T00068]|uniref:gluconokinase n=1 Tax=Demequina lignilytica TaxID=3051663 RepID=UPI00262F620F|nr:gluconokinase [Demequina sp. SYSU T00068]MDN4489673.1 gluconokinase [Demequina sp. SYSU T00068]